jgi:hypothetical protein
MDKLYSISKTAEILDVTPKTLRIWDKENKLKPILTSGGHRRYKETDIKSIIDGKIKYDIPDKNIIRKILYLDIELTKNRLMDVDETISDNPTITLSEGFNTAVEDIIKHWLDY